MTSLSILKDIFHNTVAEGIYREISIGAADYYYYLGKTLAWGDELSPDIPEDSISYEQAARNEIITAKRITTNDVAFVVPRYNWETGSVYDQYDDTYSTKIIGIDLISGGSGYTVAPTVYVGTAGSAPWVASNIVAAGSIVYSGSNYYLVTVSGTLGTTAPNHTFGSATNGTATLEYRQVTNGGGSGATAVATILSGSVIDVSLTSAGSGYTSVPSIIIAGGNGVGATADTVISKADGTGSQKLETSKFYVLTEDFNVYKCLDNNNGAVSTVKPSGTLTTAFTTSDGYVWKFLYNVPIALRNKFLTNLYIPVTSALQNQYYSNGGIQVVNVIAAGSSYESATIITQGDGYLEANPVYLDGYTIVNPGTGYTSPTLTVAAPFDNVSTWSATSSTFVGEKLEHNSNIYEVSVAGTTNTVGPVHTAGYANNGTTTLKYIGTRATGTVQHSGGLITGITLDGNVREINVAIAGSGYTNIPAITIDGDGVDALATAIIHNGSVVMINVVSVGSGFTEIPTIIVGTEWTPSTPVSIGDQIFYENRLYTVTDDGTTSTTAPTHTGGAVANGTSILTYAGVPATAVANIKYGAGYSKAPTVTINDIDGVDAEITIGVTKSEARLAPVIEDGQLTSVRIIDGGIGYSYVNLTVAGTGTGAEVQADLSPGSVNTLQANIELLTIDGEINNIQVVSGGYGYSAANIVIDGDGAGATATATISNGKIVKINITNPGSGYRTAKIVINGNGYGAKARAIISPYGGHGKNSINELFARTLMFYSNVSLDKNQGFDVNNDYRQIGIIKSPKRFNSQIYATNSVVSACWVIGGNIDTTKFPADINIFDSEGHLFRVVTNNGSSALIQSLDNIAPEISTYLKNENGDNFIITNVTAPTLDKYSGDLLFIDNKRAFTPTSEQTVTLRTVIKF